MLCLDCKPGYMKFRNIDGRNAKTAREAIMKTEYFSLKTNLRCLTKCVMCPYTLVPGATPTATPP